MRGNMEREDAEEGEGESTIKTTPFYITLPDTALHYTSQQHTVKRHTILNPP